jgi:hypothetical protein
VTPQWYKPLRVQKTNQKRRTYMSKEARTRIESHRLMRGAQEDVFGMRVDGTREHLAEQQQHQRAVRKGRAVLHVVLFAVSFVFTSGFGLLGIILWVRPDSYLALILVGLAAALVFVLSFAGVRMAVLRHMLPHLGDATEDQPETAHLGISIMYGILALVVAMLLAGLLIRVATAFTA